MADQTDNYRIRIKHGEIEFESEGREEVVLAQFQAFMKYLPPMATPDGVISIAPAESLEPALVPEDPEAVDARVGELFQVEARVVSVTTTPKDAVEATLLVLYGQRVMRHNETVTGHELVRGLVATGGVAIGRSERLFESLAARGDIRITGHRRGKRYRLTNTGLTKARQYAAVMLASRIA